MPKSGLKNRWQFAVGGWRPFAMNLMNKSTKNHWLPTANRQRKTIFALKVSR
jgi:hypothetical protein